MHKPSKVSDCDRNSSSSNNTTAATTTTTNNNNDDIYNGGDATATSLGVNGDDFAPTAPHHEDSIQALRQDFKKFHV
ncbi:hypothetical protein PoB_001957500 [Plakobranchus ocellatus]|uniref:Period n=1 Tax=Plakobranchus ocellatus TaxID=259542 RepID=A0AAV3ZER3_9GAST|nr:hypothetical protein PoB_001957500 [Plakobranchus ocellatus]